MKNLYNFILFLPYIAVSIGLYLLNNAWLAMLIYHSGIILFLVIFKKDSLRVQHVFSGLNLKVLSVTIVVGSLSGIVIYALWHFMALENININVALTKYGLEKLSWYLFTVYFSIVNPLLEEIFWRGLLYKKGIKPFLLDTTFAGYHVLVLYLFINWLWVFLAFLLLVITAWTWRYLYNTLNGLAVPWLSHTVANISIVLAVNMLRLNTLG